MWSSRASQESLTSCDRTLPPQRWARLCPEGEQAHAGTGGTHQLDRQLSCLSSQKNLMKWWQQGNNLLKHLLMEEVPAHCNFAYWTLARVPEKQKPGHPYVRREETGIQVTTATASHGGRALHQFRFPSGQAARVKWSGPPSPGFRRLVSGRSVCLNKTWSPEPPSSDPSHGNINTCTCSHKAVSMNASKLAGRRRSPSQNLSVTCFWICLSITRTKTVAPSPFSLNRATQHTKGSGDRTSMEGSTCRLQEVMRRDLTVC